MPSLLAVHHLLGLALAPVVLSLNACAPASSTDDGGGGFTAEIMCEDFVKDKLRAPASAEFSEQQHAESTYGWRVTGVVDSENAFGAMLRADYVCSIKYMGKDKWRAQAVRVAPRR